MKENKVELVFATNNKHKVEEVALILDHPWLQIKTLSEIGFSEDIEETGTTLTANASIKSQTIYQQIGTAVFSEDTGLEVMALGMEPGVHTARYAGEGRSAEANMAKLLAELKSFSDRTARFRTIVSLIWDGKEYFFEGIVNGSIAYEVSGKQGFGYDPIFIPYGYNQSFAELEPHIKNEISHRYRAMQGLKRFLEERRRT